MQTRYRLFLEIVSNNWARPGRILNLLGSLFLSKKVQNRFLPISVDVEPTLACNLRCVMCHRMELAKTRKKMTMNFEDFKKIVDKLPFVLKMNLQGMGEPMLAKDFSKMAAYAKSKGIIVTTVTNGNLVTSEKIDEILESGLSRIYFSIDSLKQEKYLKYRRAGNVDLVLANLSSLVCKRNEKKSKLMIGIWMLLFEDNVNELENMVKMAKKIGVDELAVQTNLTYRGKDDWKDSIEKIEVKNEKDCFDEIEKSEKLAKKLGVNLRVNYGMGVMKPSPESVCGWPWKSLYVTSEGDVSPCCIVADPKVSCLGNIFQEKFEDIWNGKKYQLLRSQLLEGKIPNYCKECYRKKL